MQLIVVYGTIYSVTGPAPLAYSWELNSVLYINCDSINPNYLENYLFKANKGCFHNIL